jgi:hypothetical protein
MHQTGNYHIGPKRVKQKLKAWVNQQADPNNRNQVVSIWFLPCDQFILVVKFQLLIQLVHSSGYGKHRLISSMLTPANNVNKVKLEHKSLHIHKQPFFFFLKIEIKISLKAYGAPKHIGSIQEIAQIASRSKKNKNIMLTNPQMRTKAVVQRFRVFKNKHLISSKDTTKSTKAPSPAQQHYKCCRQSTNKHTSQLLI